MKNLKLTMTTILLGITVLLFTACSGFSVKLSGCSFDSCDFTSCLPTDEKDEPNDMVATSNYTFELVEESFLYKPVIKGTIYVGRYPDEIFFDLGGKNAGKKIIEPDTIKYDSKNKVYTITFEQELDYVYLNKEVATATLSYKYANVTTALDSIEVNIDDDYFYLSAYNMSTGEVVCGLDRESLWSDFV